MQHDSLLPTCNQPTVTDAATQAGQDTNSNSPCAEFDVLIVGAGAGGVAIVSSTLKRRVWMVSHEKAVTTEHTE